MKILLEYQKKPKVVSFIPTSDKVYSTQLYVIKFVFADRWLLQHQIAAAIQHNFWKVSCTGKYVVFLMQKKSVFDIRKSFIVWYK